MNDRSRENAHPGPTRRPLRSNTSAKKKPVRVPDLASALPPEFDLPLYRAHNPDLAGLALEEAAAQYKRCGRAEGRVCSVVARQADFLALVPRHDRILEIGP